MELPEPDFPSSAGRPWRAPDPELLDRRGEIAASARGLDDDAAAELAARAWRLWMAARDVAGGRAFLADALDRPGAPRSRWRALAQELGDDEALGLAHLGLSRALLEQGDHERAREHAVAARRLASRFSEAMGQAPLHMEAQALRLAGDYDAAAALFEQSLALNRRIDDLSMVDVELQNLGVIEIRRGSVEAAERYFGELPPATDDYGRFNDAAVAFRRGDPLRAQQLLADVDDGAFASDDRAELDWLREQVACAVR